ncbi:MAG: hypothetical protein H6841_00790 [Planctomycetes bacterium]|nr:hypothetical protein [Planctomycetota bacterium]
MRIRVLLFAACGVTLAACDTGSPEPEPLNPPLVQTAEAESTDFVPPANALGPSVEELLGRSGTDASPEQTDSLEPGPTVETGEVLPPPKILDPDRIPRARQEWLKLSHAERREQLEALAASGSEWAKETLSGLDDGSLKPEELDQMDAEFERELVRVSFRERTRSIRIRTGSGGGTAPMPFGKSSFGPWDTGGGPGQ